MLLTSPQTSGKSLMKIINNSGPRMLPCGIPLITFIHDENLLLILSSNPHLSVKVVGGKCVKRLYRRIPGSIILCMLPNVGGSKSAKLLYSRIPLVV